MKRTKNEQCNHCGLQFISQGEQNSLVEFTIMRFKRKLGIPEAEFIPTRICQKCVQLAMTGKQLEVKFIGS